MASLLNIGITGLTASQTALTTTGNNITNANTPGYSRQRVDLATQPQQYSGAAGYIGSGVQISGIERIVNQFMVSQLRLDTSNYQELDTYSSQISQLDSLLADQSTGLTPAMQSLFADLQEASKDPTSVPVRQVVLSDAGSLAQRFQTLYERLQTLNQGVNQQLDSYANKVNSLTQNIAKLNQEILNQGNGKGAAPNSLLDQREELLRQLSEQIGVKVVTQDDGMVNVFTGSGQPLVVGAQAATLSTAPSSKDPSQQALLLQIGSAQQDITGLVSGGDIGGLLKFRTGTLDAAFNNLGRLAITMADQLNQQQQLGIDLNGNFGKSLFTDINSASAMQNRALANLNNTGTGQQLNVFIDDSSKLTTSDYRLSFGAGGAFTLTRASDNTAITGVLPMPIPAGGATITSADGFQIQIAGGTFNAGDSFTIQPTRQGARNVDVAMQTPEELAFAQPIRTQAGTTNTGSGTVSAGDMLAVYQADGVTPLGVFNTSAPPSLNPPLLIQFTSATDYEILDNSNPAAPVPLAPPQTGSITPGQNNTIVYNDPGPPSTPAFQFVIAGHPAAGDQFSVDFNSNGSSDNRNALALAGLNLSKVVGGQTFSDAYSQLVSGVGSTAQSVKNNRDAANTLLTQSQANRDSVSAVSLDEEAANLIKFQQAYQASSQVINIARSLFTTLLGAFQ